jgi:hypothetical protein
MSLPASASGRPVSSELAGQVALITGAAHGQGRATALAHEGVHKLILDAGLLTQ